MITPGRLLRHAEFHARQWFEPWRNAPQLWRYASHVARHSPDPTDGGAPVWFFNASTRTWGLSLNAAFSLLAGWGLRLSGVPVRQLVCMAGMPQCVLGTVRTRLDRPPPCQLCTRVSRQLYPGEVRLPVHAAPLNHEDTLAYESLEELRTFEWDGLPLGELCYPSLQWALRRHHIEDNPATRSHFMRYLQAARNVAVTTRRWIERERPRAVVVFNGTTFPEAIVRHIALEEGIPAITHEVGVRPFSAFFTHGQATAYPIDLDEDWTLSAEQEARLDAYLSNRFQGHFSMAGVRFWPEMRTLPEDLETRLGAFENAVTVFTNVIFDTSQIHANTVFRDMFAWLGEILAFARRRPETLFVIRAHPDELRPGKESQESVQHYLKVNGGLDRANVLFIPPLQLISSYELIQRSKLVMIYNSSIGLEATLLGRVVLSGGQSRFTAYPTVYFPQSPEAYFTQAEQFLEQEAPEAPAEFVQYARHFTFYQHYHTSLDFSRFLRVHPHFPGYVRLRDFDPSELRADRSLETRILMGGILEGRPMVYPEPHYGQEDER